MWAQMSNGGGEERWRLNQLAWASISTRQKQLPSVSTSVSYNLDDDKQQTVVPLYLHLSSHFLRKAGTAGTSILDLRAVWYILKKEILCGKSKMQQETMCVERNTLFIEGRWEGHPAGQRWVWVARPAGLYSTTVTFLLLTSSVRLHVLWYGSYSLRTYQYPTCKLWEIYHSIYCIFTI